MLTTVLKMGRVRFEGVMGDFPEHKESGNGQSEERDKGKAGDFDRPPLDLAHASLAALFEADYSHNAILSRNESTPRPKLTVFEFSR